MLVESQSAYVLHSRKYTDSRVLVEFLTRDYGRISGVARPPRSKKRSAAVLPYTAYFISWRGRSQLKTITLLEIDSGPLPLAGTSLYCGFYLNEILLRALALEDPCEHVFDIYARAVHTLAAGSISALEIEIVLRNFELDLVEDSGFAINMRSDMQDKPIVKDEQTIYRLVDGENFMLTALAEENIRDDCFSGTSLCNILARDFSSETTRRAAKAFCRKALLPLIGERPLRSRELFR